MYFSPGIVPDIPPPSILLDEFPSMLDLFSPSIVDVDDIKSGDFTTEERNFCKENKI